jgi:hypothetical protein
MKATQRRASRAMCGVNYSSRVTVLRTAAEDAAEVPGMLWTQSAWRMHSLSHSSLAPPLYDADADAPAARGGASASGAVAAEPAVPRIDEPKEIQGKRMKHVLHNATRGE